MSAKVLGVLGGMGPAASAEFMRILAARFPAHKDQDHPVVYLLSDPKIPDRSTAVTSGGEDPSPYIKADLDKLVSWGADILAVPCNSAHCFIDKFRSELRAPLVHIAEATLDAAVKAAPKGAWMVATLGTTRTGLYQALAKKRGYRLVAPPDNIQQQIQEIIIHVKAGDMPAAAAEMEDAVRALWRLEDMPVVTACTELPLAYDASDLSPQKNISSLNALADACIEMVK